VAISPAAAPRRCVSLLLLSSPALPRSWALAILLRKFLLSVVFVIFSKNSSFQLAGALLVMFLAYSAHVRVLPYMSPGEYDVALREHELKASHVPIHARLRASIARIEARGRKKVHRNLMSSTGHIDMSAVMG
jgi:hypothetical protein